MKVFAGGRDSRRWFATFLQAHEEDARVFVGAIPQLLQLGRHLDDEVGEETMDDALEKFIAWKRKWKSLRRQFATRPGAKRTSVMLSSFSPTPTVERRGFKDGVSQKFEGAVGEGQLDDGFVLLQHVGGGHGRRSSANVQRRRRLMKTASVGQLTQRQSPRQLNRSQRPDGLPIRRRQLRGGTKLIVYLRSKGERYKLHVPQLTPDSSTNSAANRFEKNVESLESRHYLLHVFHIGGHGETQKNFVRIFARLQDGDVDRVERCH